MHQNRTRAHKSHAFLKEKKERLLGTWGKIKNQKNKMNQNKNNYEAPKVKVISFKIEGGFGDSMKIEALDQEPATQQLQEQTDHWSF